MSNTDELEKRIEVLEREAVLMRNMLLRTLDVAVSLAGVISNSAPELSEARNARAAEGIEEIWKFMDTPIGGSNG